MGTVEILFAVVVLVLEKHPVVEVLRIEAPAFDIQFVHLAPQVAQFQASC